jgi:hypothetical protein
MTLPELMLAIAGTSFVALASTSMLFAVTAGSDEDKAVRSIAVEAKAISTRLNAALRGSRRLLGLTDTRAILWTTDADADGLVDLDELRVFDFDAANTRLTSAVVDAAATPAEYDALATTFGDVVAALDGNGQLVRTAWSHRVDTLALDTDRNDNLQDATLVHYALTIRRGDLSETVAYTTALRNRSTDGT